MPATPGPGATWLSYRSLYAGSVARSVEATAAGFATSGLELGGKDAAYVRADANMAHAIETLTDGAFFNAGQSCCGIKRIYVAANKFAAFVEGVVAGSRAPRCSAIRLCILPCWIAT